MISANAVIGLTWAVFVLYWLAMAFFVKKDVRGGGWWDYWWVRLVVVGLFAGTVANFFTHSGYYAPARDVPPGMLVAHYLGALLCVAGISLAIWARRHLGANWSSVPSLKEGHELITSGPYKIVRHPIYTGILLATTGSVIANPQWALFIVVIFIIFVRRVRKEEALMLQAFPGEYPSYQARTKALLPYIY